MVEKLNRRCILQTGVLIGRAEGEEMNLVLLVECSQHLVAAQAPARIGRIDGTAFDP
jgi:hypothetical protein